MPTGGRFGGVPGLPKVALLGEPKSCPKTDPQGVRISGTPQGVLQNAFFCLLQFVCGLLPGIFACIGGCPALLGLTSLPRLIAGGFPRPVEGGWDPGSWGPRSGRRLPAPRTHYTRNKFLPYRSGLASSGRVGLWWSYMLTGGAPGAAEWDGRAPPTPPPSRSAH